MIPALAPEFARSPTACAKEITFSDTFGAEETLAINAFIDCPKLPNEDATTGMF